jgi:hypothetical protein
MKVILDTNQAFCVPKLLVICSVYPPVFGIRVHKALKTKANCKNKQQKSPQSVEIAGDSSNARDIGDSRAPESQQAQGDGALLTSHGIEISSRASSIFYYSAIVTQE